VTYKWLSLTLGVHVNTAKHGRRAPPRCTPPIWSRGNWWRTGTRVIRCLWSERSNVKSKMSLTVSVHVYSVQKAALRDSGPLYSVDYDAVKDNLNSCSRYSAIKCAAPVPGEVRRAAPQPPPPEPHQNKAAGVNEGAVAHQKNIEGCDTWRDAEQEVNKDSDFRAARN
ncbi:hypothetical protein NHX12_004303, partial [Muraenolepis orangiensis]